MLKTENLTVKRGKNVLLDNLSFSLPEGKIIVLLGANGSGKTTLLRALSSFFPKYEGKILYEGKDERKMTEEEKRKERFLLPQTLPAVALTVEELLEYGEKKKPEFLEEQLLSRRLDTLSGGERTKAYLDLMMGSGSRYRLLDEPYASLDPQNRKLLDSLLEEIKKEGDSVLVSLHDLNKALSFGDHFLVLEKGKLLFSGDKEAFLKTSIPEEVFRLKRTRLTDEEGVSLTYFL